MTASVAHFGIRPKKQITFHTYQQPFEEAKFIITAHGCEMLLHDLLQEVYKAQRFSPDLVWTIFQRLLDKD